MNTQTEVTTLDSLDYIPFLDDLGTISEDWQRKIGVYAIFDQEKVLQFVGYSRDVYLSLKQHLVRQPQKCYWLKVQVISRPSRTLLEEIQQAWITENQGIPTGNDGDKALWTDPIDAKLTMTSSEKQKYEQSEDLARIKLLKKVARRVEEDIKAQLTSRGVTMDIRFNPKIKEKGLLDLK
ncbi:MAG: GIY-YIG nuclease family protein [Prochloron sp. SP5CPC1]|nr:GIY-YIG nuclease family protein [Candidatus Paraprochloron terpiosi SP5CPC1]